MKIKNMLFLFCLTAALATAANAQSMCITFEACVDGSDYLKIENGELTLEHNMWSSIGSPGDCMECPGFNSYNFKIEGADHTVSLQANNSYLIDGAPSLEVGIESLDSISVTVWRGDVNWADTHEIFINDNSYGGGAKYEIELCGPPTTTTSTTTTTTSTSTSTTSSTTSTTMVAPEFTATSIPLAALLIVPAFAYLVLVRRKE